MSCCFIPSGEGDSKPKKRSLLPDQSNEIDPLRKAIERERTEKEGLLLFTRSLTVPS